MIGEKYRNLAAEYIYVRTAAAAYSLSLGIEVPKAEAVLFEIGHDDSLGILGFNAEMTLKVWKKTGLVEDLPGAGD